jgi:hypothetical protein
MPLAWASNDATRRLAEAYLKERIPHLAGGGIGAAQYGVIVNDGDALAVVAFHQFDPLARTMQVSMAADAPRWATRRTIGDLLRYPFERAGVFKLWAMQPDHAAGRRAARFNEGIGFRREVVLPDQYGPGVGAIVTAMTRPEWEKSKWANL